LIAFNYCKVTEFFVRPPSDFCTFKNLCTEKTNTYWNKQPSNIVDDTRVTQTSKTISLFDLFIDSFSVFLVKHLLLTLPTRELASTARDLGQPATENDRKIDK